MVIQDELQKKMLDAMEADRRLKICRDLAKPLGILMGLGVVMVVSVWLWDRQYVQFLWYGLLLAPSPVVLMLQPIFEARGRTTLWTVLFLICLSLLVLFVPLLIPEALLPLAIGDVLFLLVGGLLLGSKSILWLACFAVPALVCDIVVGARIVERWLVPLPPLAEAIIKPMLGGFLLMIATVIVYSILNGHEKLYRQAQWATITLEQQHAQLKATQAQLIQSEKMAGLGAMVAGIAHEINNPTNFVSLSSHTLEKDLTAFRTEVLDMLSGSEADTLRYFEEHFARFQQALTHITDGSTRIKTIVQDLRAFSRLDDAEKQEISLADALESTVRMVKTQYKRQIEFLTEYQPTRTITCYPAQLNQVFLNILVNACQSIQQRQADAAKSSPGRIVIRLYENDRDLIVSFEDNGCGMTAEVQQKMFEPFFTTKPVGQGTGLGMSISYGIIEKHQGRIEVNSQVGTGTTILVCLPYAS